MWLDIFVAQAPIHLKGPSTQRTRPSTDKIGSVCHEHHRIKTNKRAHWPNLQIRHILDPSRSATAQQEHALSRKVYAKAKLPSTEDPSEQVCRPSTMRLFRRRKRSVEDMFTQTRAVWGCQDGLPPWRGRPPRSPPPWPFLGSPSWHTQTGRVGRPRETTKKVRQPAGGSLSGRNWLDKVIGHS